MRTAKDFENISQRIKVLSASSIGLWGKMSVAQMLAHCQRPFRAAFSEVKTKRGLLSYLFGSMIKRNFLNSETFRKNLPTAPGFKITHQPDFEEERNKLLADFEHFLSIDTNILATKVHPFFGPMNESECYELMYKHLDHHLKQFGV